MERVREAGLRRRLMTYGEPVSRRIIGLFLKHPYPAQTEEERWHGALRSVSWCQLGGKPAIRCEFTGWPSVWPAGPKSGELRRFDGFYDTIAISRRAKPARPTLRGVGPKGAAQEQEYW